MAFCGYIAISQTNTAFNSWIPAWDVDTVREHGVLALWYNTNPSTKSKSHLLPGLADGVDSWPTLIREHLPVDFKSFKISGHGEVIEIRHMVNVPFLHHDSSHHSLPAAHNDEEWRSFSEDQWVLISYTKFNEQKKKTLDELSYVSV
ncbi:uncharacterized [Tachysurus ichikawai]